MFLQGSKYCTKTEIRIGFASRDKLFKKQRVFQVIKSSKELIAHVLMRKE